jgi:hypothetical protein
MLHLSGTCMSILLSHQKQGQMTRAVYATNNNGLNGPAKQAVSPAARSVLVRKREELLCLVGALHTTAAWMTGTMTSIIPVFPTPATALADGVLVTMLG